MFVKVDTTHWKTHEPVFMHLSVLRSLIKKLLITHQQTLGMCQMLATVLKAQASRKDLKTELSVKTAT